jgi:hypothetical protein
MADAGALEKLPLEIRLQIYAHLLVENKKIPIKRITENKHGRPARMDSHRNVKHPKKLYDFRQRRWVDAPHCTTSLLLVNQAVGEEASQVLYGFNGFEFEHAGALLCFLENIGHSKQHLRRLALIGRGVLYCRSWLAMNRSLSILQHTGNLRSFEVSHFALCDIRNERKVSVKALVSAFAPLLRSLKVTFEKQHLNVSIFDVLRIELPPCSYASTEFAQIHQIRHVHGFPLRILTTRKVLQCSCSCAGAEAKNRELIQGLKKEISTLLQPGAGQEEHKEGE